MKAQQMNGGKLLNIQILRAIASLLVVFHHASHALEREGLNWVVSEFENLSQVGAAGVDLFFVISGFIMVHIGGRGFSDWYNSGEFILRRILRIYPAYWIATSVAVVIWYFGVGFRSQAISLSYLVASFTCFPMLRHPLVDQGWTLSFEVYFYLLFAFGMTVYRSTSKFLIGAFVWFALFWIAGSVSDSLYLQHFFGNPMLFEFLAGALVGSLYRKNVVDKNVKMGSILLLLSIIAFVATAASGIRWELRALFWGIPSVFMLVAALQLPQVPPLKLKSLLVLGDSSYSTYLTHGFIMMSLPRLLAQFPQLKVYGNVLAALLLFAAVAGGWAFWKFIEYPLHRITSSWDFFRIKGSGEARSVK